MKNHQLAIAIPTYNRASILKENLLHILPYIQKNNIPIYISDDSSNDLTKDMVSHLKKENYQNIYYKHNIPALGHDNNCLTTLKTPNEEYIWYIGDSIIINDSSIQYILEIIENNNYDFIIVNHNTRCVDLESKYYDDAETVFIDLSWHITMTGATIYKRDIIHKYKPSKNYRNFPQTAVILNSIIQECNLYYDQRKMIRSNTNKESYWENKVIEVFAKDWANFIFCLPESYTEKSKRIVAKSHSLKTGILGFRSLLKYREKSIINYNIIKNNKKYLAATSQVNIILIIAISIIPSRIITEIRKLFNHKPSKDKCNEI